MRKPKIVMVGGGSYNWMPVILRDMLTKEELCDAEYWLLDIVQENADLVAAVGNRYAKEWNLGAKFIPTLNPDKAYEGADAVCITISTGGLDAMQHDVKIPERYGILQTVGDTVGPGGWARSLRNIPVVMEMGRKIHQLSPNAVILNYTNPMTTLTKTLTLVTPQPVVGLCHEINASYKYLGDIFKCKRSDIEITYGGLNHFFWTLDFTIRGKPGLPQLQSKLRGGRKFDDLLKKLYVDPQGHPMYRRLVTSELFEEYGYLPCVADRHICEFFSKYICNGEEMIEKYKLVRTTIKRRRKLMKNAWKAAEDLASGKTPIQRTKSNETAADIIAARLTGTRFVDIMNVPNIGQIPNLPMGAVLETYGVVDSTGFHASSVGPMPSVLLPTIIPHIVCQELTVEAGMTGDWDKAYQALLNDPNCSHLPWASIKKMGRELLEANRKWLPQFFGKAALVLTIPISQKGN